MKKVLLLFIAASILLPLVGCQKTPENPIVVGKDQSIMLERAQQSSPRTLDESQVSQPSIPLKERLTCPECVIAELSSINDIITIRVDADVSVPGVETIPVMRIHAVDFSQDMVTMMFNRLCGDQVLMKLPLVATKSQIEEEILNYKSQLNDPEVADSPDELARYKDFIAELEARYKTASDTYTPEPCTGQLEEDTYTSYGNRYRYTCVYGYNEHTHTSFHVKNNDDFTEGIYKEETDAGGNVTSRIRRFPVHNARMDFITEAGTKNFAQHPMLPVTDENSIPVAANGKLNVTPKEARQIAESVLESTDMVVKELYLTDDENFGNYDGIVGAAESYVYRVYCVRQTAGVQHSFLREMARPERDSSKIAPIWYYETLELYIGNEGLLSFQWSSPHTIGETVVEDATLLSFEEILHIFKTMLPITLDPVTAKEFYHAVDIKIDHIQLEYQRITEQNSIENGLLVPVWNFYGTRTNKEQSGEVSTENNGFFDPQQCFLTINAIDGSIIDAEMGY